MIFKTLLKTLFWLCFLLNLTSYSFSEINSQTWDKVCGEDNNVCMMGIKSEVKIKNSDKMKTIATAIIQIGLSKQRKMDLIDENNQTYKLSEIDKDVPVLFVNLPLNTDLRKKPLLIIDDKNLFNLNYTHCNNMDGCKTVALINDNIINLMKAGKTMTVVMGVYGTNKNMNVKFPLKNFSKSYKKLTKK